MDGQLKQKLQGPEGILCWKLRRFVLDAGARSLAVYDTEDGRPRSPASHLSTRASYTSMRNKRCLVAQVSLEGARHTVPWRGNKAFNGCGFDIVWASGRLWSLLCEDHSTREAWVDALNLAMGNHERTGHRSDRNLVDEARGEMKAVENRPSLGIRRRQPSMMPWNMARCERPPGIPQRVTPSAVDASPAPDTVGMRRRFEGQEGQDLDDQVPSSSSVSIDPEHCAVGSETTGKMGDRDGDCRGLQAENGQTGTCTRNEWAPGRSKGAHVSSDEMTAVDLKGAKQVGIHGRARGSNEEEGEEEARSTLDGRTHVEIGASRRSKASERSEEIAKASAATWEQFQLLLKKSRDSKRLVDKAIKRPQGASTEDSASCSSLTRGTQSTGPAVSDSESSIVNGNMSRAASSTPSARFSHGLTALGISFAVDNPEDADVKAISNYSRTSAITDAETSLMDTREEDGILSKDSGTQSASEKKGPLSVSQLCVRHGRSPCGTADSGMSDSAARVRELEADLRIALEDTGKASKRCVQLEREMMALTTEAELLRKQVMKMQTRIREQEAMAALELEAIMQEKKREKASTSAAEAGASSARAKLEARVRQAEAERAKVDGERAEAVQRQQELQEILSAETEKRRRATSLLEASERSLTELRERLAAVASDGDTKARLASTRSQLEAVSLERDALAKELDDCIGRLGDQARDMAAALRSRHEREMTEITSRFEVEKEALRETITLEADERAREEKRAALLVQEKKLRAQAALAEQREMRTRKREVQKVKAEAAAAAEETRNDIEKLRELHSKRVEKLEALLLQEGQRLAEARREIALCKANLAGDAGEFHRWAEEQRDQSQGVLEELAELQEKVSDAAVHEAEAREREGLAMGRLRRAMEEARLERAESAEIRRQLRETLAELESTRNTQSRKARTEIQLQRAVEIAQQEIAMLEAERSRWLEERRSMEKALERLTRLVYGPPPRGAPAKSNVNTSISTTRKYALQNSWKTAEGTGQSPSTSASATEGNNSGHASDRKGCRVKAGVSTRFGEMRVRSRAR